MFLGQANATGAAPQSTVEGRVAKSSRRCGKGRSRDCFGLAVRGSKELAHAAKLVVPALQQLGSGHGEQFGKRTTEHRIEETRGCLVIEMRAPFRFGHNLVDDAQLDEVWRGD